MRGTTEVSVLFQYFLHEVYSVRQEACFLFQVQENWSFRAVSFRWASYEGHGTVDQTLEGYMWERVV